MVRSLSPVRPTVADKREAILRAATSVFAGNYADVVTVDITAN